MITVKILGPGCANCQKLERETRAALDEATIAYELTKVTDYADIAAYSVMNTPALIINEAVVSTGKIPKHEQIVYWARERENE
jgi:small redox-active disulfide protein 2